MGADRNLARGTTPILSTIAGSIAAISVTVALVITLKQRAIESGVRAVALAGPVHTDSAIRAIIGASP
jgi:hypothetical protein